MYHETQEQKNKKDNAAKWQRLHNIKNAKKRGGACE